MVWLGLVPPPPSIARSLPLDDPGGLARFGPARLAGMALVLLGLVAIVTRGPEGVTGPDARAR